MKYLRDLSNLDGTKIAIPSSLLITATIQTSMNRYIQFIKMKSSMLDLFIISTKI